jgi:hypothetical protein
MDTAGDGGSARDPANARRRPGPQGPGYGNEAGAGLSTTGIRSDDQDPFTTRAPAGRYRPVLLAGAVYDGALGLLFLFFHAPVFRVLGVAPGTDPIYVELAAGLIALLGFGLFLAWREPLLGGGLVLYGAAAKAFYVGLAVYALVSGQLPHPLFLVLAVVDIVFFAAFVGFLRATRPARDALRACLTGSGAR